MRATTPSLAAKASSPCIAAVPTTDDTASSATTPAMTPTISPAMTAAIAAVQRWRMRLTAAATSSPPTSASAGGTMYNECETIGRAMLNTAFQTKAARVTASADIAMGTPEIGVWR